MKPSCHDARKKRATRDRVVQAKIMIHVQHENNDKSMIHVFFFLGETSSIGGCFCGFVVPGASEGSTGRLIFVVVFGEARDRTCDPWFTRRVT